MTTSGISTSSSGTRSSTLSGVVPPSRAACDACWITGPSITGSENGIPISTASAPFAAAARIASSQPGYPPVMYGTSALRPCSRIVRRWFSSGPVTAARPER